VAEREGDEDPVLAGVRHDPTTDTYEVVVVRAMNAPASEIYHAWTRGFDAWFAAPGALRMRAEVGEPFWFDVVVEGVRHPHYGRFTKLEPDRVVEMTWLTGRSGTLGAANQALVTVELHAYDGATMIRVTHGGFYDAESARQHGEAWPAVLEHLDDVLSP
jgi:uncharacterized protein YndB with AHSA1/START domain